MFAGRALTAQYMPLRADMAKAIAAEGKAEGRVSFNNSWPINELQIGDVYVADGMGKIIDGTLIGSNLGEGSRRPQHSPDHHRSHDYFLHRSSLPRTTYHSGYLPVMLTRKLLLKGE